MCKSKMFCVTLCHVFVNMDIYDILTKILYGNRS